MQFKKFSTRDAQVALLSACLVIGTSSIAGSVTLPFQFTPGTTIIAEQVNQNFSVLASAIGGSPFAPVVIDVDCSADPMQLQAEVDATGAAEHVLFRIPGGASCGPLTLVGRSHLTISARSAAPIIVMETAGAKGGGTPTAMVDNFDGAGPAIFVHGSRNIRLEALTAIAGSDGIAIEVTSNSSVRMSQVNTQHTLSGIHIRDSSDVVFENSVSIPTELAAQDTVIEGGSSLAARGFNNLGAVIVNSGSRLHFIEFGDLAALSVNSGSQAVLDAVSINLTGDVLVANNSHVRLQGLTMPSQFMVKAVNQSSLDIEGGGDLNRVALIDGSSASIRNIDFFGSGSPGDPTFATVEVLNGSALDLFNVGLNGTAPDLSRGIPILNVQGGSQVYAQNTALGQPLPAAKGIVVSNGDIEVERNSSMLITGRSRVEGYVYIALNSSLQLGPGDAPGGGPENPAYNGDSLVNTRLQMGSRFFADFDTGFGGSVNCQDPDFNTSSSAFDIDGASGGFENLCSGGF